MYCLPYLHLSIVHGSPEGNVLSRKEFVAWSKRREMFEVWSYISIHSHSDYAFLYRWVLALSVVKLGSLGLRKTETVWLKPGSRLVFLAIRVFQKEFESFVSLVVMNEDPHNDPNKLCLVRFLSKA